MYRIVPAANNRDKEENAGNQRIRCFYFMDQERGLDASSFYVSARIFLGV
jgi:hypothetical protein